MLEDNYHKLLNFVKLLSLPKYGLDKLQKMLHLTELDGNDAVDIFANGTDYMEAEIAIKARDLMTKVGE